jgi:uncharacterized protein (DUF1800 family)
MKRSPEHAPLGEEAARHLLARTGFGTPPGEVSAFARLAREEAVDRLLEGLVSTPSAPLPAWADEADPAPREVQAMSVAEREAHQRRQRERGIELREWWLREMLAGPSPLSERLTLFWHGHFATSQRKVRSPRLMARQNLLLRRHGAGRFGELLHAIARDPAMLIYLDGAGSRRGAPNENFAREVMELFTLGEGAYSERDVKEAARAFTGWGIDREAGEFRERPALHDGGEKTVLGRSGRLRGGDVLDLLLARPETAEHLTRKLWREFISPLPEPAVVTALAAVLRDARYEIRPWLRAAFLSEPFWRPANRASLIKSPVDLVAGTLRTFGIRPFVLRPAAIACAQLGQDLFGPPNVKGWPGGEHWINAASLLARKQLLERLFRGRDGMPAPTDSMAAAPAGPEARMRRAMEQGMRTYAFDAAAFAETLGTDRTPSRIERLVLAQVAVHPAAQGMGLADLARHLVADPAYQLR